MSIFLLDRKGLDHQYTLLIRKTYAETRLKQMVHY